MDETLARPAALAGEGVRMPPIGRQGSHPGRRWLSRPRPTLRVTLPDPARYTLRSLARRYRQLSKEATA